jgi:protein required for attachment to host cells
MLSIQEAPMHEQAEIPHNTLVLVGDGRKALFLRNQGVQTNIKLEVERRLLHETPPTREMGTDRPGRTVSGPGDIRSAMEQTDWHRMEEDRFVDTVAGVLAREAAADPDLQIAIVLPPKALGHLRAGMSAAVHKHVIAEIPKDLTHHPIPEIAKHLRG